MQKQPQFHYALDNIIHESAQLKARCISVLSPNGNAGSSSLALSIATRYKAVSSRILVLDLNSFNPLSKTVFSQQRDTLMWDFATISAQLNVNNNGGIHYLSISQLAYKDTVHSISTINDAFDRWKQEFDYIIVDMSPILDVNSTIPSRLFSQVSDLTLLVVSVGRTTEEQLIAAFQLLSDLQFNNIKTVISQIHLPPLGPLLVKVLRKLPFVPTRVCQRIEAGIARQFWLNKHIGE